MPGRDVTVTRRRRAIPATGKMPAVGLLPFGRTMTDPAVAAGTSVRTGRPVTRVGAMARASAAAGKPAARTTVPARGAFRPGNAMPGSQDGLSCCEDHGAQSRTSPSGGAGTDRPSRDPWLSRPGRTACPGRGVHDVVSSAATTGWAGTCNCWGNPVADDMDLVKELCLTAANISVRCTEGSRAGQDLRGRARRHGRGARDFHGSARIPCSRMSRAAGWPRWRRSPTHPTWSGAWAGSPACGQERKAAPGRWKRVPRRWVGRQTAPSLSPGTGCVAHGRGPRPAAPPSTLPEDREGVRWRGGPSAAGQLPQEGNPHLRRARLDREARGCGARTRAGPGRRTPRRRDARAALPGQPARHPGHARRPPHDQPAAGQGEYPRHAVPVAGGRCADSAG